MVSRDVTRQVRPRCMLLVITDGFWMKSVHTRPSRGSQRRVCSRYGFLTAAARGGSKSVAPDPNHNYFPCETCVLLSDTSFLPKFYKGLLELVWAPSGPHWDVPLPNVLANSGLILSQCDLHSNSDAVTETTTERRSHGDVPRSAPQSQSQF